MRAGIKHHRTAGLSGGAPPSPFLPAVAQPEDLPPEPVGIAEMAGMFGITHRTLHFYEEKGLISAGRIGPMRVYTHGDVARMSVINVCREVGIPVATIQEMMVELQSAQSQNDADTTFRTMLMARKREMIAELSVLRRRMQQINTLVPPDDAEFPAISNDNPDPAQLSDLERQCLALMAEGYTPMRLARALELQITELDQLEAGILRKFDARNRFQAVAKAVLLGIIQA